MSDSAQEPCTEQASLLDGGLDRPDLTDIMKDPVLFTRFCTRLRLRRYQQAVAHALAFSVLKDAARSLVVMFPRQSGKNELQAQLEVWLMLTLREKGAQIVKVSPTWKPQAENAMRRLERVLNKNPFTRGVWHKEGGHVYHIGQAQITFLSGAPESSIVGATAGTLLEVDEAQDVEIEKFDKDIAPMAASQNATRIFWGTAWTSRTLLARELRLAREAEKKDGRQRVFVADAETVAAESPAYGRFVAEQVKRLGRENPLVRTQYFSEEIDGEGGMFPPERRARMRGSHAACSQPRPGVVYALLLDVAGQDESADGGDPANWDLRNPARDATALTVVEVDLSTLEDPALRAPTYRCVQRRQWLGVRHPDLYSELLAMAEAWQARHLVVDATGVGAGLASFLERALGGRVIPFVFQAASKSQLGWDFLALVDAGRWKEPLWTVSLEQHALAEVFERQLEACQFEIVNGPERRMRWGVPDGLRDPASGAYVHDDLLVSAALSALLDRQKWTRGSPALVVPARDPLSDLDKGF